MWSVKTRWAWSEGDVGGGMGLGVLVGVIVREEALRGLVGGFELFSDGLGGSEIGGREVILAGGILEWSRNCLSLGVCDTVF